jgi:cytochrome c-type biogenesis protein CcmH/NrfG
VSAGQSTSADELRKALGESENLVVNWRGQGAKILTLLENMDRIAALWPVLESAGQDLRAEGGRWHTLEAQVHRYAPGIVRELRAAGGAEAVRQNARSKLPAGATGLGFWWYLDQEVARRRRQQVTKFVLTVVTGALIVAGGLFLFQKLFPVDPRVAASSTALLSGKQKIEANADFAGALADFESAARALPNDAEPWLWAGAVYDRLGRAADAQTAFERARSESSSALEFYLARSVVYAQLKANAQARSDIATALKLDPENPQAFYYLATVAESEGKYQEALVMLEKAGELAEARGQSEIVAMSRFRLGMLLQAAQAQQMMPATPTP